MYDYKLIVNVRVVSLNKYSPPSNIVITFIMDELPFSLVDTYVSSSYLPWSCFTRICPAFANSVDPNQVALKAKPIDLDLHCLSLIM